MASESKPHDLSSIPRTHMIESSCCYERGEGLGAKVPPLEQEVLATKSKLQKRFKR